jgi:UDP:flavonoid glycosyltransferase YjiC (YdhE family)
MKFKKILFANFPADGHFNPLTGLAVHLKNLGHDVRWYTGRKYEQKLKNLGIPFYPLKRAIDFSVGEPDQIFPERKRYKNQIAKLKFDIKHAFVLRGPEYYRDIEEINNSFSFDMMVADNCFTGISFVKQLMEKPVIAIGVVPLPETSKDLPPSGLGLTPSSTFFGKRVQDIMRAFTDKFIFGESKKLIDKIYDEHGMKKMKGNLFDVISREADLLLQSGTPGFEYFRSDLGKNVRFVGPLLPFGEKQNKKYELPAVLKQYRKKILVTQGTVETDVEKIIVPTLEAFKNSAVLVVVTTGGSKTEALKARYPHNNVLIEDFIPFNDIMPECDVYVTNGGYGGVLLSVQNKLPMVVAGIHEGKNEINARVGYFKLGINLRTEKPTPSQIKTNVEIVLNDALYKHNVTKLAEEFEQYNAAWRVEHYVNELLLKAERNTRSTFLRMIQTHAEQKVY